MRLGQQTFVSYLSGCCVLFFLQGAWLFAGRCTASPLSLLWLFVELNHLWFTWVLSVVTVSLVVATVTGSGIDMWLNRC